jgi:hypothetical protein
MICHWCHFKKKNQSNCKLRSGMPHGTRRPTYLANSPNSEILVLLDLLSSRSFKLFAPLGSENSQCAGCTCIAPMAGTERRPFNGRWAPPRLRSTRTASTWAAPTRLTASPPAQGFKLNAPSASPQPPSAPCPAIPGPQACHHSRRRRPLSESQRPPQWGGRTKRRAHRPRSTGPATRTEPSPAAGQRRGSVPGPQKR